MYIHYLFAEFCTAYDNKNEAWKDYYTYGGLPLILSRKTDELKSRIFDFTL